MGMWMDMRMSVWMGLWMDKWIHMVSRMCIGFVWRTRRVGLKTV